MSYSNEERKNDLKKYLESVKKSKRPTIYTVLRHVSASGMSRSISVKICLDNEVITLDYSLKELGIAKFYRNQNGLKVTGCGMDMGFDLVDRMFACIYGFDYVWQKDFRHSWI